MKIGPILLINLLLTGSALFVYDTVKGDPEPVRAPAISMIDSGGEITDVDDSSPVELIGNGGQMALARIKAQEKEIASIKELLAKLQAGGSARTVVNEDGTTSPAPMASLDLPDVVGDEKPVYDEQLIKNFRSLWDAAEAQRREERITEGLQRQLDRLGVKLDDTQTKGVIDATKGMREKMRDVFTSMRGRGSDDGAREEMQASMEELRGEYSKTIYSLVPAAEAEKIVEGMSNNRGWGRSTFAGGDGGNRRGGGRGR
jgi:hypothetical protein